MSTQEKFNQWLDKITREENPSEKIIAYNFGVFERPSGYCLYLVGSEVYEEFDNDWACRNDFVAEDKYFELSSIDFEGLKWDKILENIVELIKNYMLTPSFKNSFLNKKNIITAGFDSGDLVKIKSNYMYTAE